MKNIFARKATCVERLFMAFADCGINTTFRFLIHIDKKPSIPELERAFHKAIKNCRNINLKYSRGKWYFSEYLPKFNVIESDYDDIYEHPISFIDHRQHTVSFSGLYHKKTQEWYLSFEVFHGACDGKSALDFIYDIFSALNDQPLHKYNFEMSDVKLVKQYSSRFAERPSLIPNCRLSKSSNKMKMQFDLNMLSTNYHPGSVTGKISFALSQIFSLSKATAMIPVDLRSYANKQNDLLFGNLCLPLFCECSGKYEEELMEEIRQKLKHGTALSLHSAQHFIVRLLPDFLLSFVLKLCLIILRKTKRFVLSGLVSYLGKVNVSRLQNPFFNVTNMTTQTSDLGVCGFTIVALGFQDQLNISIGCDKTKIDQDTYLKFTKMLETYLN